MTGTKRRAKPETLARWRFPDAKTGKPRRRFTVRLLGTRRNYKNQWHPCYLVHDNQKNLFFNPHPHRYYFWRMADGWTFLKTKTQKWYKLKMAQLYLDGYDPEGTGFCPSCDA